MLTTIKIPEELLVEVMKLTGAATKSQTIRLVLKGKIALQSEKEYLP